MSANTKDRINNIFIDLAKTLKEEGNISSPRGMKTIELENVWFELTNPKNSTVTLPSRNLSLKYLENELAWYLSGSLNVRDIEGHSSFWSKLANSNGTVNSNYGFLAMKEVHNGKSQLEWCVDKINADKDTRQAVINYNQPKHKYESNKDFVCTIAQLFRVNNNKLDSTVMMRSQDMIFGLSYDLPWFTMLQEELARRTKLEVGKYNHFTASLHVYERHFKMLDEISNDKYD